MYQVYPRRIKSLVLFVFVALMFVLPSVTNAHTTGTVHEEISKSVSTELAAIGAILLKASTQKNTLGSMSTSETELVKIAKRRGELMRKVAKESPQDFLIYVIPDAVQKQLPVAVQKEIEQATTETGLTEVIHEDDFVDYEKSVFHYALTVAGKKRTIYFSGDAPALSSGDKVIVSGYTLGDVTVAPTATGLTVVTAARPASTGTQKTLIIPVTSPAVGNAKPYTIIQLQQLIFRGPFQDYYKEQSYNQIAFFGTTTEWLSVSSKVYPPGGCGFGYLDISDSVVSKFLTSQKINLTDYSRVVFVFSERWGGCSIVGKNTYVIGNLSYELSQAWTGLSPYDTGEYKLYADDILVTTPFASTPEEYAFTHCRIYAKSNPSLKVRCTWNGSPLFNSTTPTNWVGGMSYFSYVMAHEMGHSLGVWHANALYCPGNNLSKDCYHVEYGNEFDVMGRGMEGVMGTHPFTGGHFNAYYKNYLGWLAGTSVKNTSVSGQTTLTPLETSSGVRMLKITNPALPLSPLYVEYRRPIGFDAVLSSKSTGLFINEAVSSDGSGYNIASRLLNANQQRTSSFTQPALLSGYTFSDPQRGISITNQGTNASVAKLSTVLTQPICLLGSFGLENLNIEPVDVTPGSGAMLAFTITNNDSISCQPSTLVITSNIKPTASWNPVVDPAEIIIAPRSTEYVYVAPLAAASGSYTHTLTVTDTRNNRIRRIDTAIIIAASPKLKLTAPNGGEKWELGTMNDVTWTPYAYSPIPINTADDVVAYLERANGTSYEVVGKIIENGKASIHWMGDVGNYGSYPAPGQYYIRIKNTKTTEWDRSDAPFTILPLPVDVKVNDSNGPLNLADKTPINVSWVTNNMTSCSISGVRKTANGSVVEGLAVPAISTTTKFFVVAGRSVQMSCTRSLGQTFYDYVIITNPVGITTMQVPSASSLRVTAPNGGEVLMAGKSYQITWNQTGLFSPSVALYRDDMWVKWLGTNLTTNSFIWTPTAAEAVLSSTSNLKIYVTAKKLDGTGYVDDKSDQSFKLAPATTATLPTVTQNQLTSDSTSEENLLGTLMGRLKELLTALQLLK